MACMLDRYLTDTLMTDLRTTISHSEANHGWSVIASFDDKSRLVINEGNKDDDIYIQVASGELDALARVLNRTCKPRAKTSNREANILQMLDTLFGDQTGAFADIERFFKDNGITFNKSHWIGS